MREEGILEQMTPNQMPTYDALMNPLLRALRQLGGSASIGEIYEKIIELEDIDEELQTIPHSPGNGNKTEIAYRLAWVRTYLKKYGILNNSSRGVWALTERANQQETVDPREVVSFVRALDKGMVGDSEAREGPEAAFPEENEVEEASDWHATIYEILTQRLTPDGFERLTQRLLRESGFVQVEVTGRTGDGGIDGKGIAKIHGFMSFHVVFQCKRYNGSVSASAIRDFRGAMVGRADKGLFITTGSFTPAAIKEATRDGAPPIDLVDGDELAEKLKELGLGVQTKMVEHVEVEPDWFLSL